MRYQMQEGTIELSDHHWQDRTAHILSCEDFPIKNVNIVITREALPKGRGIDAHLEVIAETFQEMKKVFLMVARRILLRWVGLIRENS